MATEISPLMLGVKSTPKEEDKDVFGDKTIDFFGGFSLLVNNMTGPGVVLIAPLFQQAGWLTPILMMFVTMIIASFSSTFLCEAMSRIPGNDQFQDRIELTTLAKFYFGRWGFYVTIILFVLSLESMNIASIIESAQTMDLTVLAIFKITCGLEFYPHPGFICERTTGDGASPFGNVYLISIGFLIVLIVAIPLGYYNLDDNIIVQKVAFMLFMGIIVQWVSYFIHLGFDFSRVPVIGSNQSSVLGTIIFNYAFVITIPSWVNEKKVGVNINRSLWSTSSLATFLFILLGLMGAWTYDFTNPSQDLLDVINRSAIDGSSAFQIASRVTVYLFPLVTQLSGIPVMSIIIRYNLLENRICGKVWANFWAVIFPWMVAVPFYTGTGLSLIITWASLFINGFINFVIPLLIFIMSHNPNFLKKRRHMLIRTSGRHRTNIIGGEVPDFINIQKDIDDEESFQAFPHNWYPHWFALSLIAVMTLGILANIVISIASQSS